ncbi:MAG TPA: SDR family NAD(P)-dependent oxidoreductase [Thermoleophilaceae bacterium]|jgi:short-subunit dehydrogenase
MEVEGRTALLTGAAGGIGPAVARGLAGAGAHVALSGLPDEGETLEELRDELRGTGVRSEVVLADLTVPDELDTLCDRVEDALGPVEALVNNAGYETTAAFAEFTPEEIERIVAVNLTAPLLLTRRALRRMRALGHGHVVFMSSLAGKLGQPYNHPYSATKAGMVGLTQSLRAEYPDGPIGFSVICPGFVSGGGMYARMEEDGAKAPFMAAAVPAEDVASAVVDAIRRNRPEVIVNSRGMKPILTLQAIAPRLAERVLRRTGPDEVFKHMAEARGRLGEPIAR